MSIRSGRPTSSEPTAPASPRTADSADARLTRSSGVCWDLAIDSSSLMVRSSRSMSARASRNTTVESGRGNWSSVSMAARRPAGGVREAVGRIRSERAFPSHRCVETVASCRESLARRINLDNPGRWHGDLERAAAERNHGVSEPTYSPGKTASHDDGDARTDGEHGTCEPGERPTIRRVRASLVEVGCSARIAPTTRSSAPHNTFGHIPTFLSARSLASRRIEDLSGTLHEWRPSECGWRALVITGAWSRCSATNRFWPRAQTVPPSLRRIPRPGLRRMVGVTEGSSCAAVQGVAVPGVD